MLEPIKQQAAKRHVLTALIAASSIAAYLAGTTLLPWHMDEYIMFHRLACWDATQAINSFEEGCLKPELFIQLPIGIGFYRSFGYGGITSSLILAPFQYFWDSLATSQLVGIAFLIVSALGIQKSFKLNTTGFILSIIWFPIAYSLIHDGGPVRISFFTASWSPYLIQKYLNAAEWPTKTLCATSLLTIWLLSAEDKPYFFYLIPGIIILVAAALTTHELKINKQTAAKAGTLLLTASLLCILLILFAKVGNQTYLEYLSRQVKVDRLSTMLHSARLLIDFPENAERIIESNLNTKVFSSISISLFAIACYQAWKITKKKIHIRDISQETTLLLGSTFALWFFGWIAGGRFHHHFVFAQIPIVVVFAKCLDFKWSKRSRFLLGVLVAVNIFSLLAVTCAPKNYYFSSSAFMNILTSGIKASPPGTIINCSSWGCYYSHSLAGSNGLPVVWAHNDAQLGSLAKLAESKKVDILHICYKCDLKSVDRNYTDLLRVQDESENGWHVARYSINRPPKKQD